MATPPPAWIAECDGYLEKEELIRAIKCLRDHTGLGLKEAKEMVDSRAYRDPNVWRALSERRPSPVKSDSKGCFPAEALVATPFGPRAIERIRVGDAVWSWSLQHGFALGRTIAVLAHEPQRLHELHFQGQPSVLVTGNHRVRSGSRFVRVDSLRPGMTVAATSVARGDRPSLLSDVPITSVERTARSVPVYNLIVSPHFSYVVEGLVAHSFTHFAWLRSALHRLCLPPFSPIRASCVIPAKAGIH